MTTIGSPLALFVRKLERHARLDAADRQALLSLSYTLRELEPSTYLLREGDPPRLCSILLSGYAYRQKMTGDGARQILALHIPGDALDFQNLFLDVADHSVQTLTHAKIACVPRAAVQDLVWSRPAVGRAILVSMLIESSMSREWVLNVGRRSARARLAHLLCEFATRLEAESLDGGRGYELPMTQEQLADALGLTAVHVNRTLKSLEQDGLITRDRRQVRIPDWRRLREVADFTQRYLHLDPKGAAAG